MRRFLLLALLLVGACSSAQASAPLAQVDSQVHYLAQWEWVQEVCDERTGECEIRPGVEGDQETSYWRCPEGTCAGLIDLRTIPHMSRPGGTPEGYGWFVYDDPADICPLLCDTEGVLVADGLDTPVGLTTITNLATRLDLSVDAQTPRQILTELLQLRGDPVGETAHKPLLSSEIFLAGERIASFPPWHEPDADPAWRDLAIRVKQESYRQARDESLNRGDEHYKRVLDKMSEDYRLPPETFVPDDLEFEGTLPHETMITESFNQPDSTTVGPDLTWFEVEGAWETLNNQLRIVDGTSFSIRAQHDLSGDDHYSQIDAIAHSDGGAQLGAAVRFAPTGESYYSFRVRPGSDDDHRWIKRVSGTTTGLGSQDSMTDDTLPGTIKGEVEGSTLTGTWKGTDTNIVTDSSLTGALRTGVFGSPQAGDTSDFDNFEAADLEVAETRVYLNITKQISPTPTADDVKRWLLAREAVTR